MSLLPWIARRTAVAHLLVLVSLAACGDDDGARTSERADTSESPDDPAGDPARGATSGTEDDPARRVLEVPWEHLVPALPEEIGPFHASGEVQGNPAEVDGLPIASVERSYTHGDRGLTLRIVDTREARGLVTAFFAARAQEHMSLDELAAAGDVHGFPSFVSWSRDTGESEAQVLVAARYLVRIQIWPANERDEADRLLRTVDLEGLLTR